MKYHEWFLYESVSEDSDTLTAVPRGNDPLDQYANMITVIEHQAYTDALKMLEEMAQAIQRTDKKSPLMRIALNNYRKFKAVINE